jgi:guanylate kinase
VALKLLKAWLLRVNKATYELSFKDHFDKVIVNDDLEKARKEAEEIVRSFIDGVE